MKKFIVLLAALAARSTVVVGGAFAQASTFGQRQALALCQVVPADGGLLPGPSDPPARVPVWRSFSHADAVWGVNHAHANWNAEAVRAAKSYLEVGALLPGRSDPPA